MKKLREYKKQIKTIDILWLIWVIILTLKLIENKYWGMAGLIIWLTLYYFYKQIIVEERVINERQNLSPWKSFLQLLWMTLLWIVIFIIINLIITLILLWVGI